METDACLYGAAERASRTRTGRAIRRLKEAGAVTLCLAMAVLLLAPIVLITILFGGPGRGMKRRAAPAAACNGASPVPPSIAPTNPDHDTAPPFARPRALTRPSELLPALQLCFGIGVSVRLGQADVHIGDDCYVVECDEFDANYVGGRDSFVGSLDCYERWCTGLDYAVAVAMQDHSERVAVQAGGG